MPYIEIREIDQTTPGVNDESFEVAYVPGLVDIEDSTLYNSNGTYVGIEANKPTLFTDVSSFEALCGRKGFVYEADQYYNTLNSVKGIEYSQFTSDPLTANSKGNVSITVSSLYKKDAYSDEEGKTYPVKFVALRDGKEVVAYADVSATLVATSDNFEVGELVTAFYYAGKEIIVKGFNSAAVPMDGIMIRANTVDPGYVMAKELLSAGMNVMFERVNPDSLPYTELASQPADISTSYMNYSAYQDKYVKIQSSVTPEFVKDTYYSDDKGTVLTDKPADWSTSYYNYYEKVHELKPLTEKPASDVVVYKQESSFTIAHMYDALSSVYDADTLDRLSDKGNFSIKYITSGGYPVYEYNDGSIVTAMINLAAKRGDCVALIDHTDNLYRESNVDREGSLFYAVNMNSNIEDGTYGTMFTPWASYNRTTVDREDGKVIKSSSIRMPASFAYLVALADSNKTNAPWLAVAGAARGSVKNLADNGMTTNIPNGVADKMQPRSVEDTFGGKGKGIAVNAITNVRPYGWTIWGNRTLHANESNLIASSFLNIRNLVSDVKKTCYQAARKLTFEQNNDVLWVNFKSEIQPLLDRMKSGYGISGYKLVRDQEHERAAEKATLCAKIYLYPVYAVEDFYITIVLKDDEITVE